MICKSWTHFWFKYTHFMRNLYLMIHQPSKGYVYTFVESLIHRKGRSYHQMKPERTFWLFPLISIHQHYYRCQPRFLKTWEKSNLPLEGEIAAFANLDKMCSVIFCYVTREQQSKYSLWQSLNPYSSQYRFIICLPAFFESHSIWNCDSKFGFQTVT